MTSHPSDYELRGGQFWARPRDGFSAIQKTNAECLHDEAFATHVYAVAVRQLYRRSENDTANPGNQHSCG